MKISVIGLGYVGLPLYINLLGNKKIKKVIGVEKNSKSGVDKIKEILEVKQNYFENARLNKILKRNRKKINLTINIKEICDSDFIFVCIPFHIEKNLHTNHREYFNLIKKIYFNIKKKTILILNSTVPPGFTDNLIRSLKSKKIYNNKISIVFSPERIEPGQNYLKSLINSPRVFSSNSNKKISHKIKKLFSIIFKIKDGELMELNKFTEAELCKVLENTYRASNIAFIEEWGLLSHELGVNLFSIISAIKFRKTHSNIMKPGLGVGGYCLTKDPYFAKYTSKYFLKKNQKFPFIDMTMKINSNMHNNSINFLKRLIDFNKKNKIAIFGATYQAEVNDLRNSASLPVFKFFLNKKQKISIIDPVCTIKNIYGTTVKSKVDLKNFNTVIFLVKHEKFKSINFTTLKKKSLVIDLNNVLNESQIRIIQKNKNRLKILGRGDI